MTVATLVVTPSAAASAYQRAGQIDTSGNSGASFGSTLSNMLQGAVDTGNAADQSATSAVANGGDLTQVVTALSKAQLALQEVTTIRDKVVQAYQQVMQMAI